ncbi:site-specific DNA-methyltransferase [Arcanobacterium ihumii]|uniref:site-specific DNA-methyltransferase n=1 Tax=Arcanobacterium ihumii TaxID=2138162 RepID=UPI000F53B64F|nr:site-specific DNA-methyltransferase [Arcanobacterium ihumii]
MTDDFDVYEETDDINEISPASPDFRTELAEQIADLAPEAVADGKIDFEKLKELLSDDVSSSPERFGLFWPGKKQAIRTAQTPTTATLQPDFENSKNWDTTQNVFIEGDNLEVLKVLQNHYYGKIKMIYIDPPYNTGEDFVYKDDFRDGMKNYLEWTEQVNGEGKKVSSNSEAEGRYHSNWLNMMYPRLKLARNLLTDDGVIFISIDDHEQAQLRKLCDEIFGENCYVATFPWRKRTAKSDVPFGISQDFEYILCYAKQNYLAGVESDQGKYYETEDFPGRPWRYHDLTKQTSAEERPKSFFTIVNPKNGEEFPANPNRTWAITHETLEHYLLNHRIIFPNDYDFLKITRPVLRYWKEDDIKKRGDSFGYKPVSTLLPPPRLLE